MNIMKKSFSGLDVRAWTDEPGHLCPHRWTAARRELSVSGASVSLGILARPKGWRLQLLVRGI